jgi:hypothetical protein
MERADFRAMPGGEWAQFSIKDTDYGIMIGAGRQVNEKGSCLWHITHWLMPSYSLIAAGGPGQTLLCNARIPIGDENFMLFRIQWNPDRPLTTEEISYFQSGNFFGELIPGTYLPKRTMDNDFLIDRELQRSWNYTGIKSVPEQDQAVTCSMGPIVDRSQEHLGSSDTAIVALRRRLLRALHDHEAGVPPYPANHGDVYRVRQVDVLLKNGVAFDVGAKELLVARA